MANKLDHHYNDFGGIDSRTNQMLQNPKTARDGKNFAYRTDGANNDFDVLGKRRGFQHKSLGTNASEIGLMEYKYTDINTGEEKTQILGVSRDGKLRKRIRHRLKITRSGGSVAYYSLYYDSVNSNWKIEFLSSAYAVIASTNFASSVSLDTLVTTLTGLSITGLTFSAVDDSGAGVTSSYKAYLLDVTYRAEVLDGDSTYNELFDWELVVTPVSDNVLFPYVASGDWQSNSEFEGAVSVNLNNSLYITCGDNVVKYDGYAAYLAGMPRSLGNFIFDGAGDTGIDGFVGSGSNGSGTLDVGADYQYKRQLGFVDANGVVTMGKIINKITVDLGVTEDTVTLTLPPIHNEDRFPVFACKANGSVDLASAGNLTITVDAGHNIKAGMLLRIPIKNTPLGIGGWSYMHCLVASVGATSIVLDDVPIDNGDSPDGSNTVMDNQWLNAGYADASFENTVTDINPNADQTSSALIPPIYFGAFQRIWRTKGDEDQFYHLVDIPLQLSGGGDITFVDIYPDSTSPITGLNLSTVALDDQSGEDLPRLCRYVSKWQDTLLQAGRPYDPESVLGELYPTTNAVPVNDWGTEVLSYSPWKYTEADLCDFQSVYWADSENQEGFPQNGLNEKDFRGRAADKIRGLGETKDAFYVLKDRTIGFMNGTLANGDLAFEILESDFGCCAHNSIQNVDGGLLFLDELQGFIYLVAGRLPELIGFPLQDKNKENIFLNSTQKLRFSGAKSAVHEIDNMYLCYVPQGTNDKDNETAFPIPQADSLVFVFDYSDVAGGKKRNAWYLWKDINMAGGILSTGGKLLCSSLASVSSGDNYLWSLKKTGSVYDFSDHSSAVSMIYKMAWLTYGAPNTYKKWIAASVNTLVRAFTLKISQYYDFVDSKVGEISVTFTSGATVSPKIPVPLNKEKALALSLGFENNTIHEDVSINGWEVQYSPEYDPGEVKK